MTDSGKTKHWPRPKVDQVVWGIDTGGDSFPLVCGERNGSILVDEPLVCPLDIDTSGAIVYADEATARAAHARHPDGSMGARGVVRRLRFRPAGWTQYEYAHAAD